MRIMVSPTETIHKQNVTPPNKTVNDVSLGTTTKSSSNQSSRASYDTVYKLLDQAQYLLSPDNHRVCICTKYRIPNAENATITRNLDEKRASFGGLVKCGDVWACPVCSRKISEERRVELQKAVETAKKRGMGALMLTLTHSHGIKDKLKDNRDFMQKCWSRLTSGRWWAEMRDYFGIVGHVRSIEITHGEHGWHLHIHTLIFTDSHDVDTELMESYFKSRWVGIVERAGGKATKANGATLSTHENKIAEYIAKFGHMPNDENAERLASPGNTWNESHEIAKQVSKVARTESGRTPFQLLKDSNNGDNKSAALYVEYVKAMKHARQLVWSKGLKELLLDEEEKTDDEIANEPEIETVATIDIKTFRVLSRCGLRGVVLDMAANGKDKELHQLLDYLREWTWKDKHTKN